VPREEAERNRRRPRQRRDRRQEKIEQREKKNRGEREIGFPKDLCVNSENCKRLSIKHKFHINLKP
jgi:hypothetical protein